MAEDITITGHIDGKDKKKHSVEIKIKKGSKDDKDKRRKHDQIRIKVDDNDITSGIVHEQQKEKERQKGEEEGEQKKKQKLNIRWISTEKNGFGGSTGVADGIAIQVHCPEVKGEKDTPHIIIQISEGTRKKLREAKELIKKGAGDLVKELAKEFGFPDGFPDWLLDLADGDELRIEIIVEEQEKINHYFDDPELPKQLF